MQVAHKTPPGLRLLVINYRLLTPEGHTIHTMEDTTEECENLPDSQSPSATQMTPSRGPGRLLNQLGAAGYRQKAI